MADGAKPPRGLLITGAVLMLLALGGCGYGCSSFVGFIGDLTDVAEGSSTVALGQPTTLTAGGTDNAIILTSTSSASCEVRDSSGADIPLEAPGTGTTGTVESGGTSLEFRFSFSTDEGETYQILCMDEFEGSGEYAVVPFSLGRVVGGLAGIGIGALLFIIGVILLIVGLVQRSKWKKRQVPGAPMGGYSPPPPGAGQGYGAPGDQPYGAPAPGYGQPPSGYPAPPPGGPTAPPPAPGGPTAPPPAPGGPGIPPPPAPGGPTAPPPAPWPPQSEPPSGPPTAPPPT